MNTVHHHPDGLIYVRVGKDFYSDTPANFVLDFGLSLPSLPSGAIERIYDQGRRHCIAEEGNVIAGGEMPWPLGDSVIANFAAAKAAQHARRNPPPPPPTLAEAKAAANAKISAQFHDLATVPINFAVGGTTYTWDADEEAVRNITGVVLLFTAGRPVPNPRTWCPYKSLTPVSVTHADLIGLGGAIADRKDALFTKKKTKQSEVASLTDVASVQAYDVNAGW